MVDNVVNHHVRRNKHGFAKTPHANLSAPHLEIATVVMNDCLDVVRNKLPLLVWNTKVAVMETPRPESGVAAKP